MVKRIIAIAHSDKVVYNVDTPLSRAKDFIKEYHHKLIESYGRKIIKDMYVQDNGVKLLIPKFKVDTQEDFLEAVVEELNLPEPTVVRRGNDYTMVFWDMNKRKQKMKRKVSIGTLVVARADTYSDLYVGQISNITKEGNIEVSFADGDFAVYKPEISDTGITAIASGEVQRYGLLPQYSEPVKEQVIANISEVEIRMLELAKWEKTKDTPLLGLKDRGAALKKARYSYTNKGVTTLFDGRGNPLGSFKGGGFGGSATRHIKAMDKPGVNPKTGKPESDKKPAAKELAKHTSKHCAGSSNPLKALHALLSKTSVNGCTPITRNTFGVDSDVKLATSFLYLDTYTAREDIRAIQRLLQLQLGIKDKHTLEYADVSKDGYPVFELSVMRQGLEGHIFSLSPFNLTRDENLITWVKLAN